MGYELYEHFGGDLPDVVIYPTGGGTGLIGMWKAFEEMAQLGWVRCGAAPAHGQCAEQRLRPPSSAPGRRAAKPHRPGRARRPSRDGLRVPAAVGDFLILPRRAG